MKLSDIGAGVCLIGVLGLTIAWLLLLLIGGTFGLFWLAFFSDFHWIVRVPAGIFGAMFTHGVLDAMWKRFNRWLYSRQLP